MCVLNLYVLHPIVNGKVDAGVKCCSALIMFVHKYECRRMITAEPFYEVFFARTYNDSFFQWDSYFRAKKVQETMTSGVGLYLCERFAML